MTQPLETDVNVAIRPKNIISNILFSIPVTHENKLHVIYLFFPFDSEHSDTQLLYIGLYLLKSDSSLDAFFKPVKFFFFYSCPKFHVQTFG